MDFHMVMERHTDLRVPVLQCIALLTGITHYNIGTQCLECLHYLVNSHDAEFRAAVNVVLSAVVLPYVTSRDDIARSSRILAKLAELQRNEGGLDFFLCELLEPIKSWVSHIEVTKLRE
jgi:hypothetical protein